MKCVTVSRFVVSSHVLTITGSSSQMHTHSGPRRLSYTAHLHDTKMPVEKRFCRHGALLSCICCCTADATVNPPFFATLSPFQLQYMIFSNLCETSETTLYQLLLPAWVDLILKTEGSKIAVQDSLLTLAITRICIYYAAPSLCEVERKSM